MVLCTLGTLGTASAAGSLFEALHVSPVDLALSGVPFAQAAWPDRHPSFEIRIATGRPADDLQGAGFAACFAADTWRASLAVRSLSLDGYAETWISGALDWAPAAGVHCGVQAEWFRLGTDTFGAATTWAPGFQAALLLDERLSVYAAVTRLGDPGLGQLVPDGIGQRTHLALAWRPWTAFTGGVLLAAAAGRPASWALAVEGRPLRGLALRAGCRDGSVSAGFGWDSGGCRLDYGVRISASGTTHVAGIGWAWRHGTSRVDRLPFLDINAAGVAELRSLPGLGDALAHAVYAERLARGRFYHVDDLLRVRGIGYRRWNAFAARLAVAGDGSRRLYAVRGDRGLAFINTAGMRELAARGLAPRQARDLVLARERSHGFLSIDELYSVPGLGADDRRRLLAGPHGSMP